MPKFLIKISTSIGSRLQGITRDVKFPKCNPTDPGDKFIFKSSLIKIECKRRNSQKKEEIENNPSNTIHLQIKRALLLYYAANAQKARVYSISVYKLLNNQKVSMVDLKYDEKNQPIRLQPVPMTYQFPLVRLCDNTLGVSHIQFEKVLSHWLGAWTTKERYDRFARFWRCLEQLSKRSYHGANPNEKNCLEALRAFMLPNSVYFPLACSQVDTMTTRELRSFQWKLLIYNNFKKTAGQRKYDEYRDQFVLAYSDERVMHMLQDTLVYREQELRNKNVYTAITNHLTTELNTPHKNNIDVVTILSAYYAYYTRNKIFHGELQERTFSISNTSEDGIVDKLNVLLEKVTFELINIYHLL